MSHPGRRGAALIALDDDILLFGQLDERDDAQESTLEPTRKPGDNEYSLAAEGCEIGRDPACAVRVRRRRTDISRRHATIKREDGAYVLYDHSTQGTFVNGQRVSGLCRLDADDEIGLSSAKAMLRFVDYDRPARLVELTDREREVLRLLDAGRSIKEIADLLVISQNTVSSHLKNLYEKLGVGSRAEAVSQARKLRLL